MVTQRHTKTRIGLRVSTWFIGVCATTAVIVGIYALCFDYSRYAPLGLLFIVIPWALLALVLGARLLRLSSGDVAEDARKAATLATSSALALVVATVLACVPLTARFYLFVPAAAAAALFALFSARRWGKN